MAGAARPPPEHAVACGRGGAAASDCADAENAGCKGDELVPDELVPGGGPQVPAAGGRLRAVAVHGGRRLLPAGGAAGPVLRRRGGAAAAVPPTLPKLLPRAPPPRAAAATAAAAAPVPSAGSAAGPRAAPRAAPGRRRQPARGHARVARRQPVDHGWRPALDARRLRRRRLVSRARRRRR